MLLTNFYTFQIISYLIDVYRGKIKAQDNFFNLATYVSLFPQLIAGPIVRYEDINDNLIKKILEDEYYSSTAEEYKIRKPENTTSKFSEYLSEYVVDEETVIPDLPEY